MIGFVGFSNVERLVFFLFFFLWGDGILFGFEVSGNAGSSVILCLCGNVCSFSGF